MSSPIPYNIKSPNEWHQILMDAHQELMRNPGNAEALQDVKDANAALGEYDKAGSAGFNPLGGGFDPGKALGQTGRDIGDVAGSAWDTAKQIPSGLQHTLEDLTGGHFGKVGKDLLSGLVQTGKGMAGPFHALVGGSNLPPEERERDLQSGGQALTGLAAMEAPSWAGDVMKGRMPFSGGAGLASRGTLRGAAARAALLDDLAEQARMRPMGPEGPDPMSESTWNRRGRPGPRGPVGRGPTADPQGADYEVMPQEPSQVGSGATKALPRGAAEGSMNAQQTGSSSTPAQPLTPIEGTQGRGFSAEGPPTPPVTPAMEALSQIRGYNPADAFDPNVYDPGNPSTWTPPGENQPLGLPKTPQEALGSVGKTGRAATFTKFASPNLKSGVSDILSQMSRPGGLDLGEGGFTSPEILAFLLGKGFGGLGRMGTLKALSNVPYSSILRNAGGSALSGAGTSEPDNR